MKLFSFTKQERLCNYKRIDLLFRQGEGFLIWPLSVRFLIRNGEGNAQIMTICPKRYQKNAVMRNRIKRLIRENYRLNNSEFKKTCKDYGKDIDFSVSFVSKTPVSFIQMQNLMCSVLEKLQQCLKHSQQ